MLTIEEALELPSVLTVTDVGYIAKPNTVEVVLSDKLAPQALTRTAFVLPFLARQDAGRCRGLYLEIQTGSEPK